MTLLASSLHAGVSERGLDHIRAVAAGLGVTIREGARVSAVGPDAIFLEDGACIPAAMTIWAAGFSASPLGAASGLPVNGRGQIVVDAELRVAGHDDIFAAGDGAAPPPGMDDFLRMGCASAMPMAAHAADNLAAQVLTQPLAPHRFAFFISCISLGRRNGLIQGLDARDRPSGRVITGRLAALMKDLVCRYVIGGIRVERRLAGAYRWPSAIRAGERAALPAAPVGDEILPS